MPMLLLIHSYWQIDEYIFGLLGTLKLFVCHQKNWKENQVKQSVTIGQIQYWGRQKNSLIYITIYGSDEQTTEIDMYPIIQHISV